MDRHYDDFKPPLRPASLAFSLPGSKEPDEALPPSEATSRWCCQQILDSCQPGVLRTSLSGSMLANPPVEAFPPLDAISLTSSLGLGELARPPERAGGFDKAHRLAKLPGLVFSVMLMVCM